MSMTIDSILDYRPYSDIKSTAASWPANSRQIESLEQPLVLTQSSYLVVDFSGLEL